MLSWFVGEPAMARSEMPKNERAKSPMTIHTIRRIIPLSIPFPAPLPASFVDSGHSPYNLPMTDLAKALTHFKRADPVLYAAAKKVRATLTTRTETRGEDRLFVSLAESVVSQQLSVKASDTIWGRVKEACKGKVTPEAILKVTLPRLRKAGLSAAKAKTLKELAKAMKNGLKLGPLRKQPPEVATERLTKVWGIGPWTSEMFLMFGLGHPDIFSKGDLGLIRSIETLYAIKNPTHVELEAISIKWSPYRTTASRILWRARDSI